MNSVCMTPAGGKPDVLDDFLRGREFLDEIRGRAPHVLHLGRMGLDGLLSWADLGSVLETGLFAAKGDLMFTRAREVAPLDSYTRLVPGRDGEEGRELVPDRCQELFNDGYTVTVVCRWIVVGRRYGRYAVGSNAPLATPLPRMPTVCTMKLRRSVRIATRTRSSCCNSTGRNGGASTVLISANGSTRRRPVP